MTRDVASGPTALVSFQVLLHIWRSDACCFLGSKGVGRQVPCLSLFVFASVRAPVVRKTQSNTSRSSIPVPLQLDINNRQPERATTLEARQWTFSSEKEPSRLAIGKPPPLTQPKSQPDASASGAADSIGLGKCDGDSVDEEGTDLRCVSLSAY